MKQNNLTRHVFAMLLAALLFLTGTLPASADDTQTLSDARWSNGSYSATLGDMAGRRLYVYGIADSLGEGAEPETDSEIVLVADADITRLEAAMLLYRLCGTEEELSCPFTDVPEIYLPAVRWLYAAGITRGISAEQYGTGYLTRAQFLTMLSRLLAWESAVNDAQWDEAVYEAEFSGQARENYLLPVGVHDEGLKHGDVYLILLALMQKYFPEKQTPVRAEMSLPDQITLTASSIEDAEAQLAAALQYAPNRVELYFTADCAEDVIVEFYGKYNTNREGYEGEYPFITRTNTAMLRGYSCSWLDANLIVFRFYSYAPAYLAYLDAADWLRCFEDEAYSRRLSEFREKEILPLVSPDADDYTKARKAQELVCRIAFYDWAEYRSITQGEGSAHPEAHSITGFLSGGSIVCDGYAKVYQWILTCLGVDCFVVYGVGAGDNHAWNKVRVNGNWYNADVCWKDTGSGDYYFLRSDSFFRQNRHSFSDDYVTERFASTQNYDR